MTTRRDRKGIAYGERHALGLPQLAGPDHAPEPTTPDPRRAVCVTCGRNVHYVRRSYGPHGRAGHWQHTGDGLAQYRSWH